MPLYDYRCTECDEINQFDLPLGSLDDQICPSCGGTAKRVFQVFETPPKIGGGACSMEGLDEDELDSYVDDIADSLSAAL